MAAITPNVNGVSYSVEVDPAGPLLYVLADDLALNEPKFGCGLWQCGACTVLPDGKPIRSCATPISDAIGHEVTTIEGLRYTGEPASHPNRVY
jgi:aerobic-type carbon monoxide dehydrogenase small subunit (CoxS/CutS family)